MKMQTKKMTATAMFTAIIFVLTCFVKVPVASGYVHFGDALVYICACVFGCPWALFAGAVGEGLADVAGGYAVYAPATVIVKVLLALLFSANAKANKILNVKSFLFSVAAVAITVGGYFAADMLIDKTYAVVDILGNVIQGVGSAVIFAALGAAFDKMNIKNKLLEYLK